MNELPGLTIVGRSGSHFTRVARMFARELGMAHDFRPVGDLLSLDVAEYAGNPALKRPILEGPGGTRFGTLNICRELSRRATSELHIVWPEDQLLRRLRGAALRDRHALPYLVTQDGSDDAIRVIYERLHR